MDPFENPFKNLLAQAQVPLGTWLMSGAPSTAEAMGCIGFDWLKLATGHGSNPRASLNVQARPEFSMYPGHPQPQPVKTRAKPPMIS